MDWKAYWKQIAGVLTLVLILGGVGTYYLVPTGEGDICSAKIDGVTVRHAWQPTGVPYRYYCDLQNNPPDNPPVRWCEELRKYGVEGSKCMKMELVDWNSPELGEEIIKFDYITMVENHIGTPVSFTQYRFHKFKDVSSGDLKNLQFDMLVFSGQLERTWLELQSHYNSSIPWEKSESICNPYEITNGSGNVEIQNCTQEITQGTNIKREEKWDEADEAGIIEAIINAPIGSTIDYRIYGKRQKDPERGYLGEYYIDNVLSFEIKNLSGEFVELSYPEYAVWYQNWLFRYAVNTNSSLGTFDSIFLAGGINNSVLNETVWVNATHSPTDSVVAYFYLNATGEAYALVDEQSEVAIPHYGERRGKLTQNYSVSTLWSDATTVVGFETNDSLHDLIGSYSFTIAGNPIVDTGPFGDYSADFSSSTSDGYINDTFEIGLTYTMYAWVKYNSVHNYILSSKNAGDTDDDAFLNLINATAAQHCKRDSGGTGKCAYVNVDWADGNYHQIVAKVNGTVPNQRVFIFADGVMGSYETIGTSMDPINKFMIGNRRHATTYSFQGWISHFEFYDAWDMPDEVIKRRYETERSTLGAEEERPSRVAIELNEPANRTVLTSEDVIFNFTATGDTSTYLCNLTIDGVLNQTNINVTDATDKTVTVTNLGNLVRWWDVSCKINTFVNTTDTYIFGAVDCPEEVGVCRNVQVLRGGNII